MIYHECILTATTETAPLLEEFLLGLGAEGIFTEDPHELDLLSDDGFGIIKPDTLDIFDSLDVKVHGFFSEELFQESSPPMHYKLIEESLHSLLSESFPSEVVHLRIDWSTSDDSTWNTWKDQYKPIQITNTITIVPTFLDYIPTTPNETIIRIEPGLAFGTGDHPTTALAIQNLEKAHFQLLNTSNSNVFITLDNTDLTLFDVGTGTGVIAIAGAAMGIPNIYAFDLDEQATKVARQHIQYNPFAHHIIIKENNLLEGISEKAHIIVANIVPSILQRLIPQIPSRLYKDGLFILSGIPKGEENPLLNTLEEVGFEIYEITEENGWVCIIARLKSL